MYLCLQNDEKNIWLICLHAFSELWYPILFRQITSFFCCYKPGRIVCTNFYFGHQMKEMQNAYNIRIMAQHKLAINPLPGKQISRKHPIPNSQCQFWERWWSLERDRGVFWYHVVDDRRTETDLMDLTISLPVDMDPTEVLRMQLWKDSSIINISHQEVFFSLTCINYLILYTVKQIDWSVLYELVVTELLSIYYSIHHHCRIMPKKHHLTSHPGWMYRGYFMCL